MLFFIMALSWTLHLHGISWSILTFPILWLSIYTLIIYNTNIHACNKHKRDCLLWAYIVQVNRITSASNFPKFPSSVNYCHHLHWCCHYSRGVHWISVEVNIHHIVTCDIFTEMNSEFEIKDTEKTPMAPTVSIEQISIVRPIKVRMLTCYKAVGRGYWRGRGNETVILVIIWN